MQREAHLGDPCVFCDRGWDQIPPGPCPGRPGLEATADAQLTMDALQDRYLRLHEINADLLALCCDLYTEVGRGGDLDWHLREQGYAERLRMLIEKAEGANGP